MRKQSPRVIGLVAAYLIVSGIGMIFGGIFGYMPDYTPSPGPVLGPLLSGFFWIVEAGITVLLGIASLVLFPFLLKGKGFARTAVIVLMSFEIAYMLEEYPRLIVTFPYVIISGLVIYFMYQPRTKEFFAAGTKIPANPVQ
jgi:hypothetical protein